MSKIAEKRHEEASVASVPGSWSKVRLGDICEIVRGVSYKKDKVRDQPAKNMVPVLRATNIQDSTLVLDSDLVYVPSDVVSEEQMLRVGDIVVATSSGSKHLVGKTAQVKEPWSGSFGAFCAALRPKTEIDHRYLGYFFGSQEYKDYISKKALGVNINNLRRGDLEEISVPVAPLAQQKHIVAEIEKQFSRLDEAVANLKRVKANLKRYKAAVLKAAVEGHLVETEAEVARREGRSYETGAQLLQRIIETRRSQWKGKGKFKEPAAPDTTDLPELPEGWVWANYEQVGQLNLGRQRAPKYHSGPNMRPYLRVQNVFEDRIDLSDVMEMDFPPDDFEKYQLTPGDLLLNEGQSPELLGRPAIYRGELPGACFTNTLIRFRAAERVRVEFALVVSRHNMRAGRFVDEGTITTNIAHLSLGRLATVEFPLPPLAEQDRIVAEVDRRLSLVREVEAQVDANAKRAQRLRPSILMEAFRGRLTRENRGLGIESVAQADLSMDAY